MTIFSEERKVRDTGSNAVHKPIPRSTTNNPGQRFHPRLDEPLQSARYYLRNTTKHILHHLAYEYEAKVYWTKHYYYAT